MPEINSTIALPWKDGAVLRSADLATPWKDGTSVYGTGGAFTPLAAPAGGTPTAPVPQAPGSTIPAATVYPATHTLAVYDERDETLLTSIQSMSMKADADSLYWSISAGCSDADRARLLAGEQPAVLRVQLDGDIWRFAVDSVSRSRKFPVSTNTIAGRSITVAAAAPYQGDQNWTVDGATTAQQIATLANLRTGLTVDWQIQDWAIPDRVFSFSGTPLLVVKAVADAVRASVLSSRADFSVRVVPRYPSLSNAWAVKPPNVEVDASAIRTDSVTRNDKPAYTGIYVSGQQNGALGFVRLAGTNGDVLHPMVTDVLITDQPAIEQRGIAELGESGAQTSVTMQLPVIYGAGRPGVIEVGSLVRVVGDGDPWVGLSRSVEVAVDFPAVTQTLTLEQHTAAVEGTVIDEDLVAADPLRFIGPIPAQSLTVGTPYTMSIASYWSHGQTPYAWSLRSGALPAGLTLSATTGVISGTPTTVATSPVAFRAVDATYGMADSNIASFTVAAAIPPFVFSGTIPAQSLTVGTAYSLSTAGYWSGGSSPYAWTVFSGSLPAGLILNAATGVISGTPTTTGSASLVLRATEAGAATANSNSIAFTVAAPAVAFTVFSGGTSAAYPNVSGAALTARNSWVAACTNVGKVSFEDTGSGPTFEQTAPFSTLYFTPILTGSPYLSIAWSGAASECTISRNLDAGFNNLGTFDTTRTVDSSVAQYLGMQVSPAGARTLTLTPSVPFKALSFYLTDVGDSSEAVTVRLFKSDSTTQDYTITAPSTADGNLNFWGFVDSATYTKAEILMSRSSGTGGYSVGIDDIAIGTPV